jgi:hypothetical protein
MNRLSTLDYYRVCIRSEFILKLYAIDYFPLTEAPTCYRGLDKRGQFCGHANDRYTAHSECFREDSDRVAQNTPESVTQSRWFTPASLLISQLLASPCNETLPQEATHHGVEPSRAQDYRCTRMDKMPPQKGEGLDLYVGVE